jgi:hypothetical protein
MKCLSNYDLEGQMKLFILIFLLMSFTAQAQVMTQQNILQGIVPVDPDSIKMNEFILDRVILEDNIYSNSRKTQLGDQTQLSMSLRYHVEPLTFTRIRFATNPTQNRYQNKTSNIEIVFAKNFNKFNIQIDLDLLTKDEENDNGGISIGPDVDSDDTFLTFMIDDRSTIVFYPFNFRSDVGDEFNTLDVSRINSIDNSPSSIGATQTGDEYIENKTIPGIEYNYALGNHNFYIGAGVATYLYPINDDFDVKSNPTPDAWERRETFAYKFGYLLIDSDKLKVNFQHLAHDKTEETGSLLESASSLMLFKKWDSFVLEYETTMSVAGKRPYNVDNVTRWFRDQTPSPFNPLFADNNGNNQDWIGEQGFGHSLKLGYNYDKFTPFISLKYQDEHFIFDGETSAHLLRNFDQSLSHGGLTRVGLGAYFYRDNMYFSPSLEYQKAQNPVFTNSTDLRADRQLSSFQDENIILSFEYVYTFDNFSANQLWWF